MAKVVHLVETTGYRSACGRKVTDPNNHTGSNRFVTCQKCRGTWRFQLNRPRR